MSADRGVDRPKPRAGKTAKLNTGGLRRAVSEATGSEPKPFSLAEVVSPAEESRDDRLARLTQLVTEQSAIVDDQAAAAGIDLSAAGAEKAGVASSGGTAPVSVEPPPPFSSVEDNPWTTDEPPPFPYAEADASLPTQILPGSDRPAAAETRESGARVTFQSEEDRRLWGAEPFEMRWKILAARDGLEKRIAAGEAQPEGEVLSTYVGIPSIDARGQLAREITEARPDRAMLEEVIGSFPPEAQRAILAKLGSELVSVVHEQGRNNYWDRDWNENIGGVSNDHANDREWIRDTLVSVQDQGSRLERPLTLTHPDTGNPIHITLDNSAPDGFRFEPGPPPAPGRLPAEDQRGSEDRVPVVELRPEEIEFQRLLNDPVAGRSIQEARAEIGQWFAGSGVSRVRDQRPDVLTQTVAGVLSDGMFTPRELAAALADHDRLELSADEAERVPGAYFEVVQRGFDQMSAEQNQDSQPSEIEVAYRRAVESDPEFRAWQTTQPVNVDIRDIVDDPTLLNEQLAATAEAAKQGRGNGKIQIRVANPLDQLHAGPVPGYQASKAQKVWSRVLDNLDLSAEDRAAAAISYKNGLVTIDVPSLATERGIVPESGAPASITEAFKGGELDITSPDRMVGFFDAITQSAEVIRALPEAQINALAYRVSNRIGEALGDGDMERVRQYSSLASLLAFTENPNLGEEEREVFEVAASLNFGDPPDEIMVAGIPADAQGRIIGAFEGGRLVSDPDRLAGYVDGIIQVSGPFRGLPAEEINPLGYTIAGQISEAFNMDDAVRVRQLANMVGVLSIDRNRNLDPDALEAFELARDYEP